MVLTSKDLCPIVPDMCPEKRGSRAASAKLKITKQNIGRLSCPTGRAEMVYIDTEVSGLVLRAYPSGRQVWNFRYRDQNGRNRRLHIGDAKGIDPSLARDLARKAVVGVAGGENPSVAKKAARRAETCGQLFDKYLAHAEHEQKPSSYEGTKRNLLKYAASLAAEPINSIDRARIRGLKTALADTAGRVQTNRVLASLSACWAWALRNGVIPEGDNPASYIDKFAEKPRERVLTMLEMQAIWRATGAGRPYHRLVRLVMLTAVRRGEAAGMRWAELVGDLWTVPSDRMKANESHEVPLPAFALDQLPPRGNYEFVFGADTPFSGWSGAKVRLDTAIAKQLATKAGEESEQFMLPDWGLHDLRRTFSTEMNSRGLAEPHIIEAVLAHTGAKGGIAGVYNWAQYRPQKRAALEAWVKLLSDEGVFDEG